MTGLNRRKINTAAAFVKDGAQEVILPLAKAACVRLFWQFRPAICFIPASGH
jgi:hypothetical protein